MITPLHSRCYFIVTYQAMTYQPSISCHNQKKQKKATHLKNRTLQYIHLEKVLVHMTDEEDAQIFKSHNDYAQNKRKFLQYLKYAET